jgi:chemotaxis protein methyltransferase CheR
MDLVRRERYSEALALVAAFPQEADQDHRALLLHATLLVQVGDLGRAEGVCRRLLDLDASSAAGHYVLALCREGLGDVAGAAEQDRIAIDLDPDFAMPHLHLGLLARRGGDAGIAERACGKARQLLHREAPDRITLFGGGFGRDALISLCRERTPVLAVAR